MKQIKTPKELSVFEIGFSPDGQRLVGTCFYTGDIFVRFLGLYWHWSRKAKLSGISVIQSLENRLKLYDRNIMRLIFEY